MEERAYEAKKELARSNREFYRAFEALDLAAMAEVWAPDGFVRCVHPGWGLLSGRERVLDAWRAIFESTRSIRFELLDLSLEVLGEVGWVTNVERIESTSASDVQRAEAVATNAFLWRDGRWRMFLHHASPVVRPTVD